MLIVSGENTMLSRDDNLILQTWYTIILIKELWRSGFINSRFFDSMPFEFPFIKEEIKKINVDNQGSALMALYAMLVVPKEILKDRYSDEYEELNTFLENVTNETYSDYPEDSQGVNFFRHIRNAVAHASVEFEPDKFVTFSDTNTRKNYRFETKLPLVKLGEFIGRLQKIHVRYVTERTKEIQSGS